MVYDCQRDRLAGRDYNIGYWQAGTFTFYFCIYHDIDKVHEFLVELDGKGVIPDKGELMRELVEYHERFGFTNREKWNCSFNRIPYLGVVTLGWDDNHRYCAFTTRDQGIASRIRNKFCSTYTSWLEER